MIVSLDIETTGLSFDTDSIRCIGLVSESFSVLHTDIPAAKAHIDQLKARGALFVMQNGRFDVKFLRKAGIDVEVGFDTMIAAYVLEERPQSLSLDSLASFYLGLPSWKGDVAWDAPIDELGPYCLTDCEVTLKLQEVLAEKLAKEEKTDFYNRLLQLSHLLTTAEYRGMNVDWERLAALKEVTTSKVGELVPELNFSAKDVLSALPIIGKKPKAFNWNSPKQILGLLKHLEIDVMAWDSKKRTKVESAGYDVLERAKTKNPICGKLLELRENQKLLSTLESYEELKSTTGRLNGSFNITQTRTGRLSSSSPNLQQVDKGPRVRGLFIPTPGYDFLIGDLAQIEVRMAAHYSQDPRMIDMFRKDEDFYGTIATELLGANCEPNDVKARYPQLRQVAKVIGLSILYGTGPNKLREGIERDAGIVYSFGEAKQIISNYFSRFAGLKELRMRVERTVANDGSIETLFGRRLAIKPEDVYMKGVNTLLQCSASDLMCFRQLEIEKRCKAHGIDQHLIALVHDELIREVRPGQVAELQFVVKEVMERTSDLGLLVPLKIDIAHGSSWACKA